MNIAVKLGFYNVKFEIEQKRLKTAEKVVRPALGCVQHPKAG